MIPNRLFRPAVHLCCLFLLLWFVAPSSAAELVGLRAVPAAEETQVVLQLDSPIRYSDHRLPASGSRPDRCYVDLYDTRPAADLPQRIELGDEHVDVVRTGIHGTMFRVVVNMRPNQGCSVQHDAEARRLVLVTRSLSAPVAEPSPVAAAPAEPRSEAAPVEQDNQSGIPVAAGAKQDSPLFFAAAPPPGPVVEDVFPQRPWSMWGRIWGFGAGDLEQDAAEDQQLLRSRSRLGLQYTCPWRERFELQGRAAVEWDVLDYDSQEAGTDSDLNLYEALLKLTADRWDFSIGRQRVRWGKSDQLSPLDSINPDDVRQFITLDLEERKIPSWLARWRLHGESMSAEAILSPWFERSDLDYFDSDWALYRNLLQIIRTNPMVPPALKDYAADLQVHERKPANTLKNMSAGLRLAWRTENSDFAVSYRYGWESLPHIQSFPVKNIAVSDDLNGDPTSYLGTAVLTDESVEARFKRQQIIGFEWETVLDPIGFRGEIAYLDQVSLLTEDLTSVSKKAAHLVAGIDYTSVDEWYFNLQTSWYRIFDYSGRILYFERNNVALLGEVRKTLWRGNLELSTRYNYTLSDGGSYLQPAVTLKYFPNTEVEVGVMLFDGNEDTLLGSYDLADQVYAQVKFSF
ncbi:MAG: hypothetical protein P8X63_03660 [Desulfuromonadaceae bacterium]